MKRLLLTAVAVAGLALASGANAQEWNGPEVGLQGGYVWGNSTGNITGTGIASKPYSAHPDGELGGGHAGYNWQFGQFVVGLEGDAEYANDFVHKTLPGGGLLKTGMDFDASARGKVGLAFNRFLVYGTGGAAFGDVNTAYNIPGAGASKSDIRIGWTAGGGLGYAITPNWSTGVEYRYTDLGHDNATWTAGGVTRHDSNEWNYNAVRLNITYRFAAPIIMPAPAPMPAAAPAPPPPAPPRTFLVFFDFDKYNLTPDARKVVEQAAASFKANGVARLELTGYTDLAGTQAYNLRLSKRRAETVAAALEKMGVPKSVINVMWRGKENPRVPTPDGVREPQNRRVEIVMP